MALLPHPKAIINLACYRPALHYSISPLDTDPFLTDVAWQMVDLRSAPRLPQTVLRPRVSSKTHVYNNLQAEKVKTVEGFAGLVQGYAGLTEGLCRVKKSSQPVSHAILSTYQWRVYEHSTQIPCWATPFLPDTHSLTACLSVEVCNDHRALTRN